MQSGKIGLGNSGIALIAPAVRRAIAEKMLGGRNDMIMVEEGLARPLKP